MTSITSTGDIGIKSFTVGATAIGANLRVKVVSGLLVVAAAADADAWIGTTTAYGAIGDRVGVRLRNAPGSAIVTCSEAISAGDLLDVADGGKIATGGSGGAGWALTAGSADGAEIEAFLAGF